SDRFEVRERATKELEAAAEQAKPLLHSALEGKPTLEKRRRVERLLGKLAQDEWNPSPNRLRALRALPAPGGIGTPDRRQVLQQLARGASEAWLTREARSALQRLATRPNPKP